MNINEFASLVPFTALERARNCKFGDTQNISGLSALASATAYVMIDVTCPPRLPHS